MLAPTKGMVQRRRPVPAAAEVPAAAPSSTPAPAVDRHGPTQAVPSRVCEQCTPHAAQVAVSDWDLGSAGGLMMALMRVLQLLQGVCHGPGFVCGQTSTSSRRRLLCNRRRLPSNRRWLHAKRRPIARVGMRRLRDRPAVLM